MTRPVRKSGFTLLELIVVIACLGVISSVGVQMFVVMTTAWNSLKIRTELNSRADSIFNQMRLDFGEVLSARQSGVMLQAAGDDKLIMAVQRLGGPQDAQSSGRVMYHVKREGSAASLYRTVGPLDVETPAGAAMELAAGVKMLKFEYPGANGQGWQTRWQGPGLPGLVRVSMVLQDPDRTWEQIARQAVFPIHVN